MRGRPLKEIIKLELLVFSQNNCAGCRTLEMYLDNEHGDVEYTHFNISEKPELVEVYGLTSTPTTILWDSEDNEELTRYTGFNFEDGAESIDMLISQL